MLGIRTLFLYIRGPCEHDNENLESIRSERLKVFLITDWYFLIVKTTVLEGIFII
jgi:hypothetical protein